jgi:peptidoglycan/LPS O-acetylase OafA/YrhL
VFLDAIRGLAAVFVVLIYVLEIDPRSRSFFIEKINFGALGVSAFIVVSGFIIPFSIEYKMT